ncbi:hypothetical protein POM88_049606 [Heracleum sosnowskyi]|uniref:Serine/threonine-protein kinase ATM n=1 Tax=Heracleum sosnowskyi TaxID=360622 RepID=A0AAD8GYI8_9APIA|nr:hypothetical protein POM88_049606 [Heracleum sosnowskyi]
MFIIIELPDTNKKVTLPRDIRRIRQLELVLVVTSTFPIDHSCHYHEGSFAHFKGLADSVTVMNGINAPKVVECLGSDGNKYRQLAKSGNDDPRQDAVMEIFFGLVNTFLQNHRDTWKWRLRIRTTYKVVCVTPSAGVLEWVSDTVPLGEYLIGSSTDHGMQNCPITQLLPGRSWWRYGYCSVNFAQVTRNLTLNSVSFIDHASPLGFLERTIKGIMYYRRALKLQAFHDMAKESVGVNGSELIGCNGLCGFGMYMQRAYY